MATAYKVLGQVNPAITTATTAYTVPSSTETVVSTISVCNFGPSPAVYRISVRPNGETQENKHFLVYDTSIATHTTDTLTLGLTMNAADVVTVYSSTASLAFNLFGSEIS